MIRAGGCGRPTWDILRRMHFLSDEWRVEVLSKLRSDEDFLAAANRAGNLSVWIVADPRPEWAENITILVDGRSVDAVSGDHDKPDGMARASYDTWLRLFRNELSPKRAAMFGKLRGKGLPILLRNMALLNSLLAVARTIPLEDPDPG